jgi:hypothetical protein
LVLDLYTTWQESCMKLRFIAGGSLLALAGLAQAFPFWLNGPNGRSNHKDPKSDFFRNSAPRKLSVVSAMTPTLSPVPPRMNFVDAAATCTTPPSVDGSAVYTRDSYGTGYSASLAGGTGSNRLLVVRVLFNGASNSSASTVTWNNVGLSKLYTAGVSATYSPSYYQVWYLVAPAAGTNTLAVNFAAATNFTLSAVWYAGVNQGGPFGAHQDNANQNAPTSYTSNITTTAPNSLISDFLVAGSCGGTSVVTRGSAQTLEYAKVTCSSGDNNIYGDNLPAAVPGSHPMGYTLSPANGAYWNGHTLEILGVGCAAGTAPATQTPPAPATPVPSTSTPVGTATAVPATSTPTRSVTAVPSTFTPTRTMTAAPGTSTPTRTPVATATSVPSGSCLPAPAVGANTPFITYEAEAGIVGGGASVVTLVTPTTEFSSPELEASGHAYVRLAGQGQYVQWTNTSCFAITAVNIRACIPDSVGGGGINATLDLYVNGAMRQAINLSSTQTWVYETASSYDGMSQSPSAGHPHVFWDEFSTFITGAAVATGGTIMLKVDPSNTAAFYYIDCMDVEAPPAPLSQPANSLSINSYGAVANSPSTDNAQALRSCMAAAQSAGKSVWIPSGTYYLNATTSIPDTGVTVDGAGPWYSTLLDVAATGTIVFHTKGGMSIRNLCINATRSMTTQDQIYAVLGEGDNWTLDNVWSRNAMLCWGTGNNIVIKNCRIHNSWGDGLNMNQGAGTACDNITVTNNFSRGNGDDGITLNSSNNNAPNMSHCTYTHNTAVASWWANEMGIYGGDGDIIENNLLQDSVKLNGLRCGSFGPGGPGSSMTNALIMGNKVVRGGSYGYANKNPGLLFGGGGAQNNVLSTNTIINAMFNGMDYSTQNASVAQYNTIVAPGLTGMGVYWGGVSGTATSIGNTVTNLNAGQVAFFNNNANYIVIPGTAAASYSGQNSVQAESCAEGGQDIGHITNGSYTDYAGINMAGATSFNARVASAGAGGNIEIRLDSPTGTLIGTCAVPVTSGWQAWTTQTCAITATSGTHTIYLVYTGGAGNLFNVEWFSFP